MGSIDIVAVGDSCGKTALLHAMRQTDFKIGNELEFINIPPTVYESYQVNFKSHGVYIRVNLHDTAGQVIQIKFICQILIRSRTRNPRFFSVIPYSGNK